MSDSSHRFPWKEYLGLCGLMLGCGFAFSVTALDAKKNDPEIQFFSTNLKTLKNSNIKLVQRFPNLSNAHTTEQALIVISLTHAQKFEEAAIILESMSKLQNSDGSWNLWYSIAKAPDWNIQTDAIAWMVLAIEHYQESFQDYRFATTAERAIRFIQHLKVKPDQSKISWYRNSNKDEIVSTQDLAMISSALEHFRLRQDGAFPYRAESQKIKNDLRSLFIGNDEWITGFNLKNQMEIHDQSNWKAGALAILSDQSKQSSLEITGIKTIFANHCQSFYKASRSPASIETTENKTSPWPLWLATELRDLPCDGGRIEHKVKQWSQTNKDYSLLGNLEELAWVYLSKNKINPLSIKKAYSFPQ